MIGTIAGDIIGARFEFKINKEKSKDFELFVDLPSCTWTDDTVMTLATAQALMEIYDLPFFKRKKLASTIFAKCYREFGKKYPDAGYGWHFYNWINDDTLEPYGSYGNGAAMRVSPCGLVANSIKEAEWLGERSASVTHNHPEGIKAAKCIAGAVFLARKGKSKKEIREYVEKYYTIPDDIDRVRETYFFKVSCQESVPESLMCFFQSISYEDCMRNCVSLGGDTDTMCAIVGTLAELYYGGVPQNIMSEAIKRLDSFQIDIIKAFKKQFRIQEEAI